MIRYPELLKKGDTIGITAPSMGANIDKIDLAISHLKDMGYKVIETRSARMNNKMESTDAYTRFKEFVELWENDDVKLILPARGGEFLIEIIPYLDEYFKDESKLEKIKWVQGYSDISTLNFYLTTNYNIATIQAKNLGNYAMNPLHESLLNPFKVTTTNGELIQENFELWQESERENNQDFTYNLTKEPKFKILNIEKYLDNRIEFSGRLIGGCLDVVGAYLHTKWDNVKEYINQFEDEGIIWHLENCELNAPEVFRKLWFMKQAGWFENVKGILIGRTFSGNASGDFEYIDALGKALLDLNIPVIYDLDIGHLPPQWTMINGSLATFEYTKDKCILKQKRA